MSDSNLTGRQKLRKYAEDTLARLASNPPDVATLREKAMPQITASIQKMLECAPPGVPNKIKDILTSHGVLPDYSANVSGLSQALKDVLSFLVSLDSSARSDMKITIGLLSADSFVVELASESTVEDLRNAIFSQHGIQQTTQNIVFGSEQLFPGKTLAEYGVGDGAHLLLAITEKVGLRSVSDLQDTNWILCDDGHTRSATLCFSVDPSGDHLCRWVKDGVEGAAGFGVNRWSVTGEHEVTLVDASGDGHSFDQSCYPKVLHFNDAVTGFLNSKSGLRGFLDEIMASGSDFCTFADVEGMKESFEAPGMHDRPGWHPALESLAETEHELKFTAWSGLDGIAALKEDIAGDPEKERKFNKQAFTHVRKARCIGNYKTKVDEHKVRFVFPGTFNSPDEANAPIGDTK